MLQAAGFIDINETVIRAPYNSWPADPHQKEIGRWYNLGLTEGLEALSLAPFTRVFQWPVHSVQRICEDAKKQIVNKKQHGYNNMYVIIAKASRPREKVSILLTNITDISGQQEDLSNDYAIFSKGFPSGNLLIAFEHVLTVYDFF